MSRFLLLMLFACYAIHSEKLKSPSLETIQKRYEKQLLELPSYKLTVKTYDSTKDPFFQDKDVESHTHTKHRIYSKKKVRQVIIHEKEILQLAPPSPRYIWYTEYYFHNNRLYYVNFRYRIKMETREEGRKDTVTEIIVFLPKDEPAIAFQKIFSQTGRESDRSFHWDESFGKIDLDKADETGMTSAALKSGIMEMTKKQRN